MAKDRSLNVSIPLMPMYVGYLLCNMKRREIKIIRIEKVRIRCGKPTNAVAGKGIHVRINDKVNTKIEAFKSLSFVLSKRKPINTLG